MLLFLRKNDTKGLIVEVRKKKNHSPTLLPYVNKMAAVRRSIVRNVSVNEEGADQRDVALLCKKGKCLPPA